MCTYVELRTMIINYYLKYHCLTASISYSYLRVVINTSVYFLLIKNVVVVVGGGAVNLY